jgi:uncharacterized DUF497 family protein
LSWIWDENKNDANKQKHKISFEVAQYVFDDPMYSTDKDPHPYEERFRTIGMVEGILILVVHTLTDGDDKTGRIISARNPTHHERIAYEESKD